MTDEPPSKLFYLDTSIFAGKVLLQDNEDKKCGLLIKRICQQKYPGYEFVTSIFTLIELAELISRKKTITKAKSILFDITYNPDLPILLLSPEDAHKTSQGRDFYDIDLLIAHFVNTALEYKIPGFDTIHAHTVKTLNEKAIAISKDNHFKRFNKLKNVVEILKASEFLNKY